MISSLTNRGKLRFMVYEETMTSQVLIRFFRQLIKDAGRKVFLILDNLRVHHSKYVQAWLKAHVGQIEVFFRNYSATPHPAAGTSDGAGMLPSLAFIARCRNSNNSMPCRRQV